MAEKRTGVEAAVRTSRRLKPKKYSEVEKVCADRSRVS